jgi:hypothetical protein
MLLNLMVLPNYSLYNSRGLFFLHFMVFYKRGDIIVIKMIIFSIWKKYCYSSKGCARIYKISHFHLCSRGCDEDEYSSRGSGSMEGMRKGFIAEVEAFALTNAQLGSMSNRLDTVTSWVTCGVLSHREKSLIDDSLCFSLLWSFYFVKKTWRCV